MLPFRLAIQKNLTSVCGYDRPKHLPSSIRFKSAGIIPDRTLNILPATADALS
ncbi:MULTISPECIES: hypothetical protein [Microcoleaceae]|uniref:hypothetical protein n=1 Tax=Microcoleaceae TaxID=1892252 RepID=UPI00187E6661|nr:hypothetical protein [Tychonema sp. LEGE 06208]MBE9163432.1 hypothetical protein [Tychonema sp. LEGE 06208]